MTGGWTKGGGRSRQKEMACSKTLVSYPTSKELHHLHRLSQLVSREGSVIKVALKSSLGLAWTSDTRCRICNRLLPSLTSQSWYIFFMHYSYSKPHPTLPPQVFFALMMVSTPQDAIPASLKTPFFPNFFYNKEDLSQVYSITVSCSRS